MDLGMDSVQFLVLLVQIVGVNIVLSGDNAVVIALAARGLPPAEQKRAVAIGSGAAVVMRIVLTLVAVELLRLPYLKLIGALLLLWIAVKLLIPQSDAEAGAAANKGLSGAVRTILIADLAMSLDNVIAVAAVAKGNVLLLVLGLAISIPLVVFASRLLIGLMERYPVIITAGAALLGWVGGEMFVSDPATHGLMQWAGPCVHAVVPLLAAVGVVLVGQQIAARMKLRRIELPAAVAAAQPVRVAGARHLLLPVDGSPSALAAVRKVIALHAGLAPGQALQVDLVNVQRGVSADAAAVVPRESLLDYLRESSDRALAEAGKMLAAAGVPFTRHQFVGDPGRVLAAYAGEQKIDEIVMGTRGLGTHTGALLGSVARSTLEHATVPVLVVRG